MKMLFNLILKIVDFFYQKKLITFLKKHLNTEIEVLIDVGAHKGETVVSFLKNFKIQNIYSFEASNETYKVLETKVCQLNGQYNQTNIEAYNTAIGNSNEQKIFNELSDSNSSTFNLIDQQSSYFKRKKRILSFFFKNAFLIKKSTFYQIKLLEFIKNKNLKLIDILKIDTEGYEFEVLKGLENDIRLVDFIYFEHHYDNMLKKNYKFSEIHDFLVKNGFSKVFKIKMPLRKSFDYIYRKKKV